MGGEERHPVAGSGGESGTEDALKDIKTLKSYYAKDSLHKDPCMISQYLFSAFFSRCEEEERRM